MNGEDGDDRDELASLYALGVIDGAGVAALRQQLQAAPGLAADLRALVQAAIGLAHAVPLIDPPLALRARVLSSVTGSACGLDEEAPDMARLDLAGQAPAPAALARAFWSRTRGMVFTATALPALPADRVYQLWVVTNGQPPVSAGLLAPDAQGGVDAHFVTPPDIPTPVALAVTLEPAGGVSQPTGEKYLVGLTGL